MEKTVDFSVKERTGLIILNRPERKNAINESLLKGLYESLLEVEDDSSISAAVITGRGDSFCSGVDLKALGNGENLFDPLNNGKGMVEVFASCNKPIIGAVNGYAITGGFEIALNCDFLIASENACFRDSHGLVGIHPGWGMTQLLQEAVGIRIAKQISMTCEPVSAEKALQWGLVNEVLPSEKLMERAFELAGMISGLNQSIMKDIKKLIETRRSFCFKDAMEEEKKGFAKFLEAQRLIS